MGRQRQTKDRLYITASEWKAEGGGHRGRLQNADTVYQRLPFHCCAISFQPVEDPVCSSDGTVFDIINAVPYIQKFKKHPVTGEPLQLSDLVRLHFHKNTDGEYACPVLGKVFNDNTHIVAVKSTGNLYCWEALNELCLKPKNFKDLLTDEPFTRKDIIHIQDPLNLSKRTVSEFDHVKHSRSIEDEETKAAREADPMFGIKNVDEDTKRALAALGTEEAAAAFASGGGGKKAQAERALAEAKAKKSAVTLSSAQGTPSGTPSHNQLLTAEPFDPLKNVSFKPGTVTWNTDTRPSQDQKLDPNNKKKVPPPYSHKFITSNITTGAATHSFTSTAMSVATKNERIRVLQQLKPTKKGYIRMHTNHGDINLELHCDVVPKTCENFIALAENGYYDGTIFHRCIKNFMIQGGDPTGTGKGGSSIFGPTFEDEFNPKLKHEGRGQLAMANSGKNTNGSQFYILFKSAHHLDFKHTVFGRVVGGFDVLTSMEKVECDDDDRPREEIKITGMSVFVNPYKDMLEEEKKEEERKNKVSGVDKGSGVTSRSVGEFGAWVNGGSVEGGSVGKYLKTSTTAAAATAGGGGDSKGDKSGGSMEAPAAKKAKTAQLANFDGW